MTYTPTMDNSTNNIRLVNFYNCINRMLTRKRSATDKQKLLNDKKWVETISNLRVK